MNEFEKLYTELRDKESLVGDVVIFEVSDIHLAEDRMLIAQGIHFDKIITMENSHIYNRENSFEDRKGLTFFYLDKDTPHAAVAIQKEIIIEQSDYDEELYQDLNSLTKYTVLIHEMAHVKDFKMNKNINWITGKTNLIKAEVFAEISTLKYLSKKLSVGSKHARACNKLARNQYSKRLIEFYNGSDIFHKDIAIGVTEEIKLKTLLQWAQD